MEFFTFDILGYHLVLFNRPLYMTLAIFALSLLVSVSFKIVYGEKISAKAPPVVTFYTRLVPHFFSRLKFNSSAPTVIYAGYEQVGIHLRRGETSTDRYIA